MLVAQVLVNKLRANAGHWHELAKMLPVLAAAGMDSTAIESETGVERVQQNAWTVSVQVWILVLVVPTALHQKPQIALNSKRLEVTRSSCCAIFHCAIYQCPVGVYHNL